MNLLAVLRAELLKLRGTLALWMCLIAPGLVVAMTVLQIAFRFSKPVEIEPHEAWMMLARAIESLWAFLMLPLFLTLEAALLAAVEHGNQQWKHLFALPVPRYRQLTAKWLVLTALLIAASLLMPLLIALGGGVLMLLKPGFGLAGSPPMAELYWPILKTVAAALFMLSIQLFVALNWRSFTAAVATGMGATVAGFLIGQSARFGPYYPWALPLQIFGGDGRNAPWAMSLGLAGGLLVAVFGIWHLSRREYPE